MVSLVIGSILIGIIMQFVLGQSRFAASQAGREEVQQNLRGALEVVASDLRGTISQSIAQADEKAIQFALPETWGLVCSSTATETLALFPTHLAAAVPTGHGVGLMASPPGGTVWLPALPTRATVSAATQLVLANTPTCLALAPVGDVQVVRLTGANHPVAPAIPAGSRIAVYRRVHYELQTTDGQTWIRRNAGYLNATTPNMQPLAGPVDADSVSFRYLAAAPGNVPVAILPPGTAAPTANIRLVRFRARTTSQQATGVPQSRQDSVTVQIRN